MTYTISAAPKVGPRTYRALLRNSEKNFVWPNFISGLSAYGAQKMCFDLRETTAVMPSLIKQKEALGNISSEQNYVRLNNGSIHDTCFAGLSPDPELTNSLKLHGYHRVNQ